MRVFLTPSAQKDLKRISKTDLKKISGKLVNLGNNPLQGKKLEGELGGFRVIRAWPYRIIYEINQKEKRIEIHKIKHRQGAYN